MKEKWAWVKRYKGLYRVSTFGRVRSVTRKVKGRGGCERVIIGRIIRTSINKDNGRVQLTLYKKNVGIKHYVHRLVLEAFVGPCPPGMEACHFPDKNPTNNKLKNLRWDTLSNNQADRIKHGTMIVGEDNYSSVLTAGQVRHIKRVLKKRGHVWGVKAGLARKFNVSHLTVRDIDLGITWRHIHV